MKKHIPFLIALALLSISLISSCKKDPVPNNGQNNDQPSDTIPNGNDTIPNGNDTIPVVIDGIRFGDTTGMIVTTYNTIMEFDEHWDPFILDLDGDGTDDIKIETYYDGPLAIGEFQELTIHCLNGQTHTMMIHGESVEKEGYSHRDTTTTTNNDWTHIIYNFTFSTCGKIEENDLVSTSTVFEITANDFNDRLSLEDHFQYINSAFLFRQDIDYTLMDDDYNEEEHVITGSHMKHIYRCWYFPTDEEKYIGFKFTKHGKSRLGWLKIMLCPTWNDRVVDTKLIETAIEK